jgi:hypothetical protein
LTDKIRGKNGQAVFWLTDSHGKKASDLLKGFPFQLPVIALEYVVIYRAGRAFAGGHCLVERIEVVRLGLQLILLLERLLKGPEAFLQLVVCRGIVLAAHTFALIQQSDVELGFLFQESDIRNPPFGPVPGTLHRAAKSVVGQGCHNNLVFNAQIVS